MSTSRGKLPRFAPLSGKPFRVSDRDVLPYSWNARDYTNMASGPELVGFRRGDNGGSSIQLHRLVRVPANVFVLDYLSYTDPGRVGDVRDLDTRLGAALADEAFVCWGQPNDPGPASLPAENWLASLTPRVVTNDPFVGATAPADPATFVGGRFVGIVDAILGYHDIEAVGYPDQFAVDLAALTPYLPRFDDFHALIINRGVDADAIGRPDLVGYYADAFAETEAQCAALAGLGFEAIAPDYTTILARIRAILNA